MALLVAGSSRAEEFASLARKLDPKLDVRVGAQTSAGARTSATR